MVAYIYIYEHEAIQKKLNLKAIILKGCLWRPKKRLNAQEETLTLSGTQRHLGGPLCTNKLQKMHVLWFAQAKLPDSLLRLHIPGMVFFVYGQELYS